VICFRDSCFFHTQYGYQSANNENHATRRRGRGPSQRARPIQAHCLTLFIPIVEEKKARWIYCGEYIGEMVGSLSPEDFRNHDQKVSEKKKKKILLILLSYFPVIFILL